MIEQYILEPLRYEFIQRALVASITIGISCGLIGTYIMLRRLSLIGDALAHAVLPGVVISFMVAGKGQLTLFIGAVISGIVTALLIGFVNRNSKIKEDTSIGIIFTGAFALGILLVSQLKQVHIDLSSYLFGDVLGVSTGDIILSLIIMIVIMLSVILFYKQLLVTSFDPTMAVTIGISTTLVHYMLMGLLSMSIVAGLQSVGVVLLVAMLITPPATAYLLTDSLKKILFVSSVLGMVASVVGLFLSYHFNFSSGASIVLVAVAFFLIAFVLSPKEGLLIKYLKRKNAARTILIEDVIKLTYKHQNKLDRNTLINALSELLTASKSTIEKTISLLNRQGLTKTQNGNLILTEDGTDYALSLIRSHRLWETYAEKEKLAEQVHPDAEKYEHILSPELADELDEYLGYPKFDPHGEPIPQKLKNQKQ
jgi:ABC-type Mn2+/Zn2+ transport system permease subunit/Mn-dependent DtxR family transcriptional regulator